MRAPSTPFRLAALAIALVAGGPIASGQEPASASGIIVAAVRGLHNDRGHVRGSLYDSPRTFPGVGAPIATCVSAIRRGVSHCVFEDVAPGRLAIGVMHDEDDDDHFDQGLFGIPQEGYGFSRNAPVSMRPPSFESAAFVFEGPATRTLEITIRYGI